MLRPFNVYVSHNVLALLVSEAALVYTCYIAATAIQLNIDPGYFFLYDSGFWGTTLTVGVIALVMLIQNLYAQFRVTSRIVLVQQIGLAIGISLLVQSLMNYLFGAMAIPSRVIVTGSALMLAILPLWRVIYSHFAIQTIAFQRVLFAGLNREVVAIAERIRSQPELGLHCVGFVTDDETATLGGSSSLGTLIELQRVVDQNRPDRLVVGLTDPRQKLPVADMLKLRLSGIPIEQAASLYESIFGRVSTWDLQPSELIFAGRFGPGQSNLRIHTLVSFVGAGITSIVLSPLFLFAAVAIKLSSPGPIFHREKRVGKDGVVFNLFHFRSMRDALGATVLTAEDARPTKVGRWLHRFGWEALPQLLNIFRGEMSLVGPRPERPEFAGALEDRIPFYRQRSCIRPGIAGWAQNNQFHRETAGDTVEEVEYDLYYIKHLSLAMDLYIIFGSVKIILMRFWRAVGKPEREELGALSHYPEME